MARPPSFPTVTDGRIESGWELVEERVETLFELPGMRVLGALRRYEDSATTATLAEATGGFDRAICFFAATRLGFDPGLPPGTMPAMILPSIRQEARQAFKRRLRERGLRDVRRGRRERARISGARLHLTSYDAVFPLSGEREGSDDRELPITGWVGVWHDDTFFVVTGGYPGRRLTEVFELDTGDGSLARSPAGYRNELFDLFRSVR